jgi:phosphoenolpyruvate carboxylase
MITAGLSKKYHAGKNELTDKNRALMERLSELSFEKYDALKHHPNFMGYLENRSTLNTTAKPI